MQSKLWRNLIVVLLGATLGLQVYQLYSNRKPPTPSNPPISDVTGDKLIGLEGHPRRGNDTSKIALIEFSDFECPFCAKFAKEISPEIDKQFSTNIIRVFVNNPLAKHKDARRFAQLGLCQPNFWEEYEKLFSNPSGMTCDSESLERSSSQVDKDLALAKSFGFTSTPAFVLGTMETDGRVRPRKIIRGAVPADQFVSTIQQLLKGSSK